MTYFLAASVLVNIVLLYKFLVWRGLAFNTRESLYQMRTRLSTTFDILWETAGEKTKMNKETFTEAVIEIAQLPRIMQEKAIEALVPKSENRNRIGF